MTDEDDQVDPADNPELWCMDRLGDGWSMVFCTEPKGHRGPHVVNFEKLDRGGKAWREGRFDHARG